MTPPGRYSRKQVAFLIKAYPNLVARLERIGTATVDTETGDWVPASAVASLIDLDDAVIRLPSDLLEVIELRGPRGLNNEEAAYVIRVHRNTSSYRYLKGLETMAELMSGDLQLPILRTRTWRDLDESEAVELPPATDGPPRGRPPLIPIEIEVRIAALYSAGSTLKQIADALNREGVPSIGAEWRPSSCRAALRRQGVPMRSSGKPRREGQYYLS